MHKVSVRSLVVSALVFVGVVAIPAAASAGTATISGKVYYQPPVGFYYGVPNADVTIYNAVGGGKVQELKTDNAGNWQTTIWAGADASGWDYKVKVEPFSNIPFDHKPPYYSFISPANGEIDLHVIPGQFSQLNNFGVRGSTITGTVFNDIDKSGTRDPGEPVISGADVTINGPSNTGPSNLHVTTAADGSYTTGAPVLPSGKYSVSATKAGYSAVSVAAAATAAPGQDAAASNFGLYWETGIVSGDVYAETNGIPGPQADEPPIGGVHITVAGTYAGNQSFSYGTQSKADGSFGLAVPNGSNYTVTETQPAEYADGPEFTAVAGVSTGSDQFTGVNVAPKGSTGPLEFGETGATISGVTFSDRNQDSARQAGEPPSGGHSIDVSAPGFSDAVTSAPDGTFTVKGAPAADVTLTAAGSVDAVASVPLVVQPSAGATLSDQNLGYRYTSLTGVVLNRANGQPVAGVPVSLSGAVSRSTTTAADGSWGFYELTPGTYAVHETAPLGLDVASNTLGVLGGTSEPGGVVGIAAGLGQLGSGYQLGLAPPAAWSSGGTAGTAAGSAASAAAHGASKVTIVSKKRTAVRRSKLKLGCKLNGGEVRSCSFVLRTKSGKVLARGRGSAKAHGTALTVTVNLTKLGKALLRDRKALATSRAAVTATQASGPKLSARKRVVLQRASS